VLVVDVPVAPGGPVASLPVLRVSSAPRDPVPRPAPALAAPLGEEAQVYEALVLGTRDYLRKNGFTDAVVGLSGGIDSSLVAAVAVDALGPGHVHGLSMPSRYSSAGSVTDAAALAERLDIDLRTVAIEAAHDALSGLIGAALGAAPTGLTDENLQSRIRGVLLMAVSNAQGWIVLTTGNKSELATGYSTLYGDSAGGFAVIKDVPKTLVYRLCRYRNHRDGCEAIPESVLTKAPSAELRPDQRDDQSLPPYEVLDPLLDALVLHDRSIADVAGAGYDPELVARVASLVDRAEYKRRQSPPGVRITAKAFGKDRRMPITNRYRDHGPVPAQTPTGEAADGGAGRA
jgi:NAD+ synthase (glutamine-hydrolysing)